MSTVPSNSISVLSVCMSVRPLHLLNFLAQSLPGPSLPRVSSLSAWLFVVLHSKAFIPRLACSDLPTAVRGGEKGSSSQVKSSQGTSKARVQKLSFLSFLPARAEQMFLFGLSFFPPHFLRLQSPHTSPSGAMVGRHIVCCEPSLGCFWRRVARACKVPCGKGGGRGWGF